MEEMKMDWAQYQDQVTVPVMKETEKILARAGKSDSYTLEDLKAAIRKAKQNINRRERNQAMSDMGLKRVRGALGGVYWE